MVNIGLDDRRILHSLCCNSKEVLIRSAMEGFMGDVWVDSVASPKYALICVSDFAYVLGTPPTGVFGEAFLDALRKHSGHHLIIPENQVWESWLLSWLGDELTVLSRYSLSKVKNYFERDKLISFCETLPSNITVKKIDSDLYKKALQETWSSYFCCNYSSFSQFEAYGLGYVAMEGELLLAGCASYSNCKGMLEIEVSTRKEYRRQGLALACSAYFILDCLERSIYPNWDAANLNSAGVAQKLGYILEKEYMAYKFKNSQKPVDLE